MPDLINWGYKYLITSKSFNPYIRIVECFIEASHTGYPLQFMNSCMERKACFFLSVHVFRPLSISQTRAKLCAPNFSLVKISPLISIDWWLIYVPPSRVLCLAAWVAMSGVYFIWLPYRVFAKSQLQSFQISIRTVFIMNVEFGDFLNKSSFY